MDYWIWKATGRRATQTEAQDIKTTGNLA